jgi:hydroxymethylpyrimidine/phosphomethylpyrimidine kinase
MSAGTPNVLTIAGSDPSGGAGIQGDLKTFAALRVYGCAVPTALTVQSSRGVHEVMLIPADFVVRQLDVLFEDVDIHAVKIGMIGSAAVARGICDVLRRYRPPFVVLDPVLRASAGGALLDAAGLSVLRQELLTLTTLITPNADEAGALLGVPAPATEHDAEEAARQLCALGAGAALVTGGHLRIATECVDVLHERGATQLFRTARVSGGGTHGTGCALSSAIAALLARGRTLREACAEAQTFVADAVRGGALLHVGEGAGPVHSLHRLWERGPLA